MAHLRRCLLSKYLKTHINENPNGGSPLLGFFFRGCSCLNCTNRAIVHQPRRNAPFTLLVQQRLLHPLEVHQPRKNCTNRANHKRLCWGCVGMAGMPYPPITARLNALRASSRPNPSQPRAARAADRRSASLR